MVLVVLVVRGEDGELRTLRAVGTEWCGCGEEVADDGVECGLSEVCTRRVDGTARWEAVD